MTESRIEEIAEESNTVITSIKHIDCLLLGVQNNYKNGERDWGCLLYTSTSLEDIYTRFNLDHPADFKGHSLSVSDIVVLHQNGKIYPIS